MNIQVVGSGCPTCKNLYKITKRAAAEIGLEAKVEYLSEKAGMQRLIELGLMQSPALIVDGKIALIGYSPSIQKIKNAILETAAKQ